MIQRYLIFGFMERISGKDIRMLRFGKGLGDFLRDFRRRSLCNRMVKTKGGRVKLKVMYRSVIGCNQSVVGF